MDILKILTTNKDYLNDFKIRSIKNSNAIEGSSITLGETKEILTNENAHIDKPIGDIKDTINLSLATDEMIYKLSNKDNFSPDLAIDLNKIILGILPSQTHYYRNTEVMITGASHYPPTPFEIPKLMNSLFDKYEKIFEKDVDFEELAKFHIEFERIHPFTDGNGRTGRMLINYCLIQNNQIPIVFPDNERSRYIDLLDDYNYKELALYMEQLQKEEENRLSHFVKLDKKMKL